MKYSVFVLLIILLVSCKRQGDHPGHVIKVVEQGTNIPIPGARVYIATYDWHKESSTSVDTSSAQKFYTNKDGEFLLRRHRLSNALGIGRVIFIFKDSYFFVYSDVYSEGYRGYIEMIPYSYLKLRLRKLTNASNRIKVEIPGWYGFSYNRDNFTPVDTVITYPIRPSNNRELNCKVDTACKTNGHDDWCAIRNSSWSIPLVNKGDTVNFSIEYE